jgi:hypothetical protein
MKMEYNKVVYVRYLPLTKAIYTDLYFKELLDNNIQVDYLDVTSIFFKDKKNADSYEFSNIIKVNSYNELEGYLKKQDIRNTLFISIMTFEWRVFKLYRIFTKFNLKLGVFARGVFPTGEDVSKRSKIERIFRAVNFQRLKLFLGNTLALQAKKMGFLKPYDYIFKAGKFGYWALGLGSEIDFDSAKTIEVNTVDYDRFLHHKKLPAVSESEYIVFLDQYLPYHPDVMYLNIQTVEPEPYYKEMNHFFDRIEIVTGQKVVIAAHPKAELYKEFNPYNNRAIFFNQSDDLVRKASVVLTHASTAISFPICYKKKIFLLMSDYLYKIFPEYQPTVSSIVGACGATLIMMDKEDEIIINQEINVDLYQDFKYKYLTSKESEQQFSKDIFIDFMKNNNSAIL